jgi:hypothetical protein
MVDDDDYERVMAVGTWGANSKNKVMHKRSGRRHDGIRDPAVSIYLHRFIMNTPDGMDTDHINGNRLDNRKENLRVCTRSQNNMNRESVGVHWHKQQNGYYARLKKDYVQHSTRVFPTYEEALEAYHKLAEEHFGEFSSRRATSDTADRQS